MRRKTNQLKMTNTEKKIIIILAVAAVMSVLVCALLFYINDFYEATRKADEAMLGNEAVEVTEEGKYYRFRLKEDIINSDKASGDSEAEGADNALEADETEKQNLALEGSQSTGEKGIIFYPGGKVEETAYAPLLLKLAEEGYEVYLVKMPAKLAILGMNRAEEIMEHASHITEWTMMGHSLGGAMAASFSAEHDEQVDALVLLAAYSTEDLTGKEMDVYSFYGTEDKVLNMEKYQEYHSNLPEDVVEEVIDGGNHSGYAHYGEQDGDGEAAISREEQQESVLDIFLQYVQ
uniref:alpha/beta fold hydrolase n=1 Tax=Agathobacter sp. TaxID=2021311 RepID=UPI0040561D27